MDLKDTSDLTKANKELESQLLSLGIDLADLPDDINNMLDKCAEFQYSTTLHDLDESYIHEWYNTKQAEEIENKMNKLEINSVISKMKDVIAKQENDIRILEEALSNNLHVQSVEEMENLIAINKKKIEKNSRTQNSLESDNSVNLDEIIDKVDLLEKNENK